LEIPLRVQGSGGIRRTNEPLTCGVPLPRGVAFDTGGWMLRDGDGRELPLQTAVIDQWSDGSLRWVLLDTQVSWAADDTPRALSLSTAPRGGGSVQRAGVAVGRTALGLSVDTGAASFVVAGRTRFLSVAEGHPSAPPGSAAELQLMSRAGHPEAFRWDAPVVERAGALRTVIRLQGRCEGQEALLVGLSLEFFAALSVIRVRLTVRNQRSAAHPGGFWELGDGGSLLLDDVSIHLKSAAAAPAVIRCSVGAGLPDAVAADEAHIYQASSGGENWDSSNHVNREGRVALPWRGYRGHLDGREIAGNRATPVLDVTSPAGTVGAAIPGFWQNFPRAVSASRDGLVVSFFPAEHVDGHELQGGEQKTHECYLLFGSDPVTERPLDWCRSPLVCHAEPAWYAEAAAMPYLHLQGDETQARYYSLAESAISGADTFLDKRERADEYGWRHFGDIYGDHEAVFHQGPSRLMSHYNNQYDPIAGFFYQFMRTGNAAWWTQFNELAAHVTDIDLYHTDADKAAYNGGLFWHTVHYVDAGKATHRSYPRAKGSNGGGPSSEQNYPTGLMLHYLATGHIGSRDAAVRLGQFVIDRDDGTRTVFRWLDRGATGLASASRTPDYHGPGRGSGNSLNALIVAHRLSGDRKYLDRAEEIIRRCTHPRQDVAALDLLDAENRWFYTMFLQSLSTYLDHKAERGALDAMYAYGREVLLLFARWMAANERPYLDEPDRLEYPTETWVAQDVRKSEIFEQAARHAAGEERSRFLERAEFFFGYVTSTLAAMPTRTLARPVVLLLVHGFMRPVRLFGRLSAAPMATADWEAQWPAPERFVTQRARATRRAVGLAMTGAALLLLAMVVLVVMALRR
jgi:hypothetical protein